MAPMLQQLSQLLESYRSGAGGVVAPENVDLVGQFAARILEDIGCLTKSFTSVAEPLMHLCRATLDGAIACFAALPAHVATRAKVR